MAGSPEHPDSHPGPRLTTRKCATLGAVPDLFCLSSSWGSAQCLAFRRFSMGWLIWNCIFTYTKLIL